MPTRKVFRLRLPLEGLSVTARQALSKRTAYTTSAAIGATGETKVFSHPGETAQPLAVRRHTYAGTIAL